MSTNSSGTLEDLLADNSILQVFLDSSVNGLGVADLNGNIVIANPALLKMLEMTEETCLGTNVVNYYHPEHQEILGTDILPRVSGGENCEVEFPLVSVHGKETPAKQNIFLITDGHEKPLAYANVITDISEIQRRHYQEMVHNQRMAELGYLMAGVAHEINNRLFGIIGNQQALERRLLGDNHKNISVTEKLGINLSTLHEYMAEREIGKALSSINEASGFISGLIKNLSGFGRKNTSRGKCDIVGLLEKTIELASLNVEKGYDLKKIAVTRRYGDVPPVYCESSEIQQVFLNILINGAQAMAGQGCQLKGPYDPEFELMVYQEKKYVCIHIGNNGPGMDEKVKSKIFEPFYTTKEAGKGTGLGLQISKAIVEDHDGTLGVFSSPGKGTNFIIKLPY